MTSRFQPSKRSVIGIATVTAIFATMFLLYNRIGLLSQKALSATCGKVKPAGPCQNHRALYKEFKSIPEFEDVTGHLSAFTSNISALDHAAHRTALEEISLPEEQFLLVEQNGVPTYFGVTMFHQLHCLHMIRDELAQGSQHRETTLRHDDKQQHGGHDHHWAHCLAYLAHAITCNADDTLEPIVGNLVFDGVERPVVNGEASLHQCHDPWALRALVEKSISRPLTPIDKRVFRTGDRARDFRETI
ncbi:hypothetical protein CBER1_11821 [Cercospora berteroae]|uniref:Oxidase ustYa n=2 Tax=Cercospora TaxID=29002 RepID=A0A2S6CLD2_9PEZI|nr:hypothetical protein CBER1_11821 [Cercospora berteroae]WPA97799.1 hypothetical protein RHO25_002410 [Cercospora beticola]